MGSLEYEVPPLAVNFFQWRRGPTPAAYLR